MRILSGTLAVAVAAVCVVAPPMRAADPLTHKWTGGPITALPTTQKVVALTIDCGSSDDGLKSILKTLHRERAIATFFVTGQFARTYPKGVRAIVARGHLVGNHSDSHPDFTRLSARQQAAQLRRANESIAALTGVGTRPWFRFPYGAYDRSVVKLVNRNGYAAVGWTVDSLGWLGTSGGQTVRKVRHRIVSAARPGEIVMMHAGANPDDGSTLDAQALPGAIRKLSQLGYSFVPLLQTYPNG